MVKSFMCQVKLELLSSPDYDLECSPLGLCLLRTVQKSRLKITPYYGAESKPADALTHC